VEEICSKGEESGAGRNFPRRDRGLAEQAGSVVWKPEILRDKKDFDRLYKRGRSLGDRYVVVFFVANGLEYNRRAFLASKKVGGSVVRNRARRLMKESFRFLEEELICGKAGKGTDILFIARKTISDAKQYDVEKSMRKALRKGKLLP